jgi:hypothetical protein
MTNKTPRGAHYKEACRVLLPNNNINSHKIKSVEKGKMNWEKGEFAFPAHFLLISYAKHT